VPQKCRIAESQVKFCGEIIGSEKRFTDPEKLQVFHEIKPPTTKTEVKRILGFFSYFREHIKDLANVAQPLSDAWLNFLHADWLASCLEEYKRRKRRQHRIID